MTVSPASLHYRRCRRCSETGGVIRNTRGRTDSSVSGSVINPSETAAGSPPDRWRNEEVYGLNADTMYVMLTRACPSSENRCVRSEDEVYAGKNICSVSGTAEDCLEAAFTPNQGRAVGAGCNIINTTGC